MKKQKDKESKLREKLHQKEHELETLFDVVQSLISLDLNEVLSHIVTITSNLTNADSCLIYLFDKKGKELILRASKNPNEDSLGRIKMKLGEGITGWVAKEKKPLAIGEKAFRDKRFKLFTDLPEDKYEAFLSVPILTKDGVVGVINIQHKTQYDHTENEIELLDAIGKIVGAAVEKAKLVEKSLALKESLETRRVLERAKGILIKKLNIDEEDAYSKIRKKSMNVRKSIRDIAEAIIVSEEISS